MDVKVVRRDKGAFIGSPSPLAYFPPPTPGRAALGLHSPSRRVCTGGRADVRTKFSCPHGFTKNSYPWCSAGALRAQELRYKSLLYSYSPRRSSIVLEEAKQHSQWQNMVKAKTILTTCWIQSRRVSKRESELQFSKVYCLRQVNYNLFQVQK